MLGLTDRGPSWKPPHATRIIRFIAAATSAPSTGEACTIPCAGSTTSAPYGPDTA
jgi:hypothetical protein